MYEINYTDRAIFKNVNGTIYQVVIDKATDDPIMFRYEKTDNNYEILKEGLEATESLEKIIDILRADLDKAKEVAHKAFDGLTDRAGVDYYTGHISAVASETISYQGEIVAYLHDIIEDTNYNFYELNNNFGQVTAKSVLILTRPPETSYDEYISLIKNPISIEVKICDLKNNMDRTRLSSITAEDEKRFKRYEKAIAKFGTDPRAVYKI